MIELVSLDAMGTLVRLEPPAPRLAASLGCTLAEAERAMRAEIAFYRAHMLDWPLDELRERAGAVLREALPARFAGRDLVPALLDALRFSPYPEAAEVVEALRARGLRVVVCSNWDASLPGVLDACGIEADDVICSADVGVGKPDPRMFAAALGDVAPSWALHAGDDPVADVAGARAAGMRAVLVDRRAAAPGSVASLRDVLPMLD